MLICRTMWRSTIGKAHAVRMWATRCRRRLRTPSLRGRLVVINLIATTATFLLISLALIANEYVAHVWTLLDDLQLQAGRIAEGASASVAATDRRAAAALLARLGATPEVSRAAIFDAEGNAVAQLPPTGAAPLDAPHAGPGRRVGWTRIDVTRDIVAGKRRVGTLRVEASLEAINRRLAWYATVVGFAAIAGVGIAVWLIDRMLVAAAGPLRQLIELMETVTAVRRRGALPEAGSEDEVSALARSFRQMLKRIRERERDLERELHDRKRAEENLAQLAHYDALTSLPNRNFFNTRLTEVLASAREAGRAVALLFIDLDNFKIVNDTLGHHVGDLLLAAAAARLRNSVRTGDITCRLGGDEFTVILDDVDAPEHAGRIAAKIVDALAKPFRLLDIDVHVSASIGISMYPKDGGDASRLMKCCDMAMYHAKENGRNNFQFFSDEMNARILRRHAVETGLRRALENGEFALHYQPQVDVRSREIVGAEALLRWTDANGASVSPQDFIPVAEETGLIIPIGEWLLLAACSQAIRWQQRGLPRVHVSVNLSARQFREPGILRMIANALEDSGLDPSLLVLEFTESILMEDSEATNAKARDLRAMGVRLAIDDFGTGYSSIGYLKRLPISEIKIDRRYVSGIPHDADGARLTQAILAMGRGLDLEVVAEGVETQAQMDFLASHHCTRAQGHLVAPALPAARFEELLRSQRHRQLRLPRPATAGAQAA
ncbi:MAG: putative bifunctional diguanylate cyclase/phosphodiesterase [Candidatus Levyibacteriota bacterium]